jgi:benzodiazapine receptor
VKKSLKSLLIFLLLAGAAFSSGAINLPGAWYEGLVKPDWVPPNHVFPLVWTAMYLIIGVAGWLIWRAQGAGPALLFWALGLALNAGWSPIMFGHHQIGLALLDIVALLVTIVAFIGTAWPVSRTAALLYVPYLAWVSFATALNYAILRLNGA